MSRREDLKAQIEETEQVLDKLESELQLLEEQLAVLEDDETHGLEEVEERRLQTAHLAARLATAQALVDAQRELWEAAGQQLEDREEATERAEGDLREAQADEEAAQDSLEEAQARVVAASEELEGAATSLERAVEAEERTEADENEAQEEAEEAEEQLSEEEATLLAAQEAARAAEEAEEAAREAEIASAEAVDEAARAVEEAEHAEEEARHRLALAEAVLTERRRWRASMRTPRLIDFALAGENLALRFTRQYHTAPGSGPGPLGPGWRHGWQYALVEQARGQMALHAPSGVTAYFQRRRHEATQYDAVSHPELALRSANGGGWDLHLGDDRILSFDRQRRLQSYRHRWGTLLTFTRRDNDGRLETIADPYGRALRLSYTAEARLFEVRGPHVGPDDLVVSFAYSPAGQLIRATQANGVSQHYAYDPAHGHLTQILAGNTQLLNYRYDSTGALSHVRSRSGSKTHDPDHRPDYAMNSAGLPTEYEDRAGYTHRRAWNDADQVTSVTGFAGTSSERTVEQTYTPQGAIAERRHPSRFGGGRKMRLVIDYDEIPGPQPNAAPTAVPHRAFEFGWTRDLDDTVVPYTKRIDFERNGRGQLLRTLGSPPGEISTELSYWPITAELHDRGQVKTITTPRGGTVRLSNYTRFGQPQHVQLPDGRIVEHGYDPGGRRTDTRVDGRVTAEYGYSDSGRLRWAGSRDRGFVWYERDEWDRPVRVVHLAKRPEEAVPAYADGDILSHVEIAFPADGMAGEYKVTHVEATTGEKRILDWRVRDAHGRVVRRVQPRVADGSNFVEFMYDAAGRQERIVQSDGSATLVKTTPRGYLSRLERERPGGPRMTFVSFERGMTGVPEVARDALGNEAHYAFDDAIRLVRYRSTFGAEQRFRYDDRGLLIERVGRAHERLSYDTRGRPTGVETGVAKESVTLSWGADGGSPVRSVETDRVELAYTHAAPGHRLNHWRQTIDGVAFDTHAEWDGDHLSKMSYPSGLSVTYTLASAAPRRVRGISLTWQGMTNDVISALVFSSQGRLEGCTFGNGLTLKRTWDMDASLKRLQSGPIDIQYARRLADNRLSTTTWDDGVTEEHDYDAQGRLIQFRGRAGDFSMQFDAIGNLLQRTEAGVGTTPFSYDGELLTAIGSDAVVHDAFGFRTQDGDRTLEWNGLGRLVTVRSPHHGTITYAYDGLGRLAQRTSPAGRRIYLYSPAHELLSEIHQDPAGQEIERRDYIYLGAHRVATAVHRAGTLQVLFHHNDDFYRCRATTDAHGEVVWRADYTPHEAARVDPTATTTDDFRVIHHLADPETGYHYNLLRWYDPRSGRYLSPDPRLLPGRDTHSFLYALGDPANHVDLYGRQTAGGCEIPDIPILGSTNIGHIAHSLIEDYIIESEPHKDIKKEVWVQNAIGMVGRVDLLHFDTHNQIEVYEIKPHRVSGEGRAHPDNRIDEYVDDYVPWQYRFAKRDVVHGTELLPDYMLRKVPGFEVLNPNQTLVIFTYPDEEPHEGMIYYKCLKRDRPAPEPEPEPVPEPWPIPEFKFQRQHDVEEEPFPWEWVVGGAVVLNLALYSLPSVAILGIATN
ncbi:MAG: RHS repeat-associated core domain-containing protein [Myxococcota bacterium]